MLLRGVTSSGRLQSLSGVVYARGNTTFAAATPYLDNVKNWENARSYDEIPGPKPLPVIGNVWRFLPGIGQFANMDMITLHTRMVREYGMIWKLGGIPGRQDTLMIYDPADVENVYRNDGVWPIREGMESFRYYRDVLRKDVFVDAGGALVTQGEDWGKFRTTVNPAMMQPKVTKLYVSPVDEVADDFIKRIPLFRDANGEMPEDFINEVYKWALESIAMIALDTRLGCLEGKLEPNSEAQHMIDNVQVIFECLFKLDVQLPIWKFISTPSWRRFVKAMDYFTELSMKYINQSIERTKTLPADHEPSVLERILARDPNPKTACVMAIDMMTAGIDTTSHAVAFLLYYLAINPDVQTKLHAEIDRVLPKSNTQCITIENLNDLKYLKACIKESMRISPVAIGNFRTTSKDLVIQNYKIPKGTPIALLHMIMSNMIENFPDPEKFIPERWLREDAAGMSSDKKTHPFVFMPFGFGPRSCVGRRFAELEIEVLVTKMMRSYRVEWHHPPMKTTSKLLNLTGSPLKFKMIDRIQS